MLSLIRLLAAFVANRFKSPRRLEIENLYLRHQLNIALRRTPQRVLLRGSRPSPISLDDMALAKPV